MFFSSDVLVCRRLSSLLFSKATAVFSSDGQTLGSLPPQRRYGKRRLKRHHSDHEVVFIIIQCWRSALQRNWLGSRWSKYGKINISSHTGAQVVVKTANVVNSCCCCFAEYYAKQRAARAAQLFSNQMTVSGRMGRAGRAERGLTEIIAFVIKYADLWSPCCRSCVSSSLCLWFPLHR